MSEHSVLFDRNVAHWVEYANSPKGRLRHELAWSNLQRHLGSAGPIGMALDAGCGLGDMGIQLLGTAREVVLFDFSSGMLEEAKRRILAGKADAQGRFRLVRGRLEDLEAFLPPGSFNLILCHNILEYVDNPEAILAGLTRRLAPHGVLSLIAANRFNEPLKTALLGLDLEGARQALFKNEFTADLFDSAPKRAFSLEELEKMAFSSGLSIKGRYGIRIFTDFLPQESLKDPEKFRLLLELEKEATALNPYLYIARYLQLICQK